VQRRINGLGLLPAVDVSWNACIKAATTGLLFWYQLYLRESNREAIKQIGQPRSKLFRYIWRPWRRALDVSGVKDVDGNASALGGDFSEEVHGVFLQ
jgi:hypothetical protein